MKPVPNVLLLVLLLSLCGLCAWQWNREIHLREISKTEATQLAATTKHRDELEVRVKAADGEILRLSGSLNDMRADSLSKEEQEETKLQNEKMRESIEKQSVVIREQNEKLAQANTAIQEANNNLKRLAAERDSLARKLNEVTAQYNKLAKSGAQ